MLVLVLAAAAVAALFAIRPGFAIYHLARAGRSAWLHAGPCLWHTWRWRWLARNAGLAYLDKHHRRLLRPRAPLTTAVRVQPDAQHLERWPRARFHVTEHGWTARVRTVPRVGRDEFAAAAPWLADAWACHRVSVHQLRPGRVELRAFRTDPLAEPFPADACPDGTYTGNGFPAALLLGRDESADWRSLALPGITGVTVTGLPGSGKSNALTSWLCQLAGSPAVHLTILDGKGSPEWEEWQGRATVLGDDLDAAEDCLVDQAREMRRRHSTVRAATGYANAWHAGPSPEFPLRVTVLDECDRFLNAGQYKGTPKDEAHARAMTQTVSSLIRRGRSVLELVILATQQGLAEAFGSSMIRNNCALSVAFAVRTRDAAVAALGDGIRDYPDMCPTTHQGPDSVGVCTASLRTGLEPFTRIRCPELSEQAAAQRAVATAHLAPALAPIEVLADAPDTVPAAWSTT